jgi:hypothetical protein
MRLLHIRRLHFLGLKLTLSDNLASHRRGFNSLTQLTGTWCRADACDPGVPYEVNRKASRELAFADGRRILISRLQKPPAQLIFCVPMNIPWRETVTGSM